MIPSAGGCDEGIQLFGLELHMSKEEIENMKTKIYGEGPHEVIRLRFLPLEEAWELEDAKLLSALARWTHAKTNK